jgi:hypothetical protein
LANPLGWRAPIDGVPRRPGHDLWAAHRRHGEHQAHDQASDHTREHASSHLCGHESTQEVEPSVAGHAVGRRATRVRPAGVPTRTPRLRRAGLCRPDQPDAAAGRAEEDPHRRCDTPPGPRRGVAGTGGTGPPRRTRLGARRGWDRHARVAPDGRHARQRLARRLQRPRQRIADRVRRPAADHRPARAAHRRQAHRRGRPSGEERPPAAGGDRRDPGARHLVVAAAAAVGPPGLGARRWSSPTPGCTSC